MLALWLIMRKLLIITCIFCTLIATFTIVRCAKRGIENRVVEYTLDNGMRWLLLKRGYAPVFAGVVQVKVGGVDEKTGKTGLAHMFEHMAFKGTKNIGTVNYAAEKKIDGTDR